MPSLLEFNRRVLQLTMRPDFPLLEKAKFLIVSELRNADLGSEKKIEKKIDDLVASACDCHHVAEGDEVVEASMSAAGH